MLITFNPKTKINYLKDMYPLVYNLLKESKGSHKTAVFGPMSKTKEMTKEQNLQALIDYSLELSNKGWVVLDLSSFQPEIDKLLCMKGSKDEDEEFYTFILPLLGSRIFKALHVRKNYSETKRDLFTYIWARRNGLRSVTLP